MENGNINYSREEYLKLLEIHFGPYKQESSSYIFLNYQNQEIAKALKIAPAHFTRLLKDQIASYKLDIERILIYAEAKQLEEEKKKVEQYKKEIEQFQFNHRRKIGQLQSEYKRKSSQLKKWYFSAILALGAIIVFQSISSYVSKKTIETKPTGYNYLELKPNSIYTSLSLNSAALYLGHRNAENISWRAVQLNMKLKAKKDNLDFNDTITTIDKSRGIVTNGIEEGRIAFDNLNFKFPSGEDFIDSLNVMRPLIHEYMFKCTNADFLDYLLSGKLADHATHIDIGLAKALPFLLDQNIESKDLYQEIESIVIGVLSKTYPSIDSKFKQN